MANQQFDADWNDPTALARFGRLEVVVRQLVEGFMVGQHKSPYKGSSVEFVEHRQYTHGDEIRHIDWRAYGKTDRYYVKEFEDETNLRCHLLVDASGSMGYHGKTLSKLDYSRYLASALGYLLLRQRDAVGVMTFDTEVRTRIEPSASLHSFQYLTSALEDCRPGGETSLAGVLEQALPSIKRRSMIVLLSDCFDDLTAFLRAIKQYRHARHEVVLLHIVTPEEENFPFSKPTQFRSLERARQRLLVDPHQLRAHYLEQYREFCAELSQQCLGAGIGYHKFLTTDPYHVALGAFLAARARRVGKE